MAFHWRKFTPLVIHVLATNDVLRAGVFFRPIVFIAAGVPYKEFPPTVFLTIRNSSIAMAHKFFLQRRMGNVRRKEDSIIVLGVLSHPFDLLSSIESPVVSHRD